MEHLSVSHCFLVHTWLYPDGVALNGLLDLGNSASQICGLLVRINPLCLLACRAWKHVDTDTARDIERREREIGKQGGREGGREGEGEGEGDGEMERWRDGETDAGIEGRD